MIQLDTGNAYRFANAYGNIEDARNIPGTAQALPKPEAFYPQNVYWTTVLNPDSAPASMHQGAPVEQLRPKNPSESASRRKEMFRNGRRVACSALQMAGYLDSFLHSGEDTNSIDDRLLDAHRIKVVGVNPDRSPSWPTGFVGSISHTERWILAAAARSSDFHSIGIDTEIVVAERLAKELRMNIGTPSEWKLLEDVGLDSSTAFTLLFSAKESFYKCWYPLQRKFLEHLDVAACEVAPDFTMTCGNDNYGVISLRLTNGHSYACNCEYGEMQINVRYCILEGNVFTLATLRKESNGSSQQTQVLIAE